MEQRGRPVIQQMSVINEHQQRTPSRPVDHGPAIASQQVTAVLAGKAIIARVGRQRRSQRPERQTPRRPSGRRASHRHPPLLGQLHARHSQRCLTHPGRTAYHRPAPGNHSGRQLAKLIRPADHRPAVHA